MKRSEMLTVLHDVLHDITGTSWNPERCDEILMALEKAGMNPPCNDKFAYDEGQVGSIVEYFCQWETEDV